MSRYTYAGDFVNPVSTWRVAQRASENVDGVEHEGRWFIEVLHSEEKEVDGVVGTFSWWAPHTSGAEFDDAEDADAWIEGVEESFEQDYDDYLDENRHDIVRMEMYELWRNEF